VNYPGKLNHIENYPIEFTFVFVTEIRLDNFLYDYNYTVGQVYPIDPYVFLYSTKFTCREYTCRLLHWQKCLIENGRIKRFRLYQSKFRLGRFNPTRQSRVVHFQRKFQLIRLDIFLGHWSHYLLLFTNSTHIQKVGDESTRCVASLERISVRIVRKVWSLNITTNLRCNYGFLQTGFLSRKSHVCKQRREHLHVFRVEVEGRWMEKDAHGVLGTASQNRLRRTFEKRPSHTAGQRDTRTFRSNSSLPDNTLVFEWWFRNVPVTGEESVLCPETKGGTRVGGRRGRISHARRCGSLYSHSRCASSKFDKYDDKFDSRLTLTLT